MELVPVAIKQGSQKPREQKNPVVQARPIFSSPFVEANTQEISLSWLKENCIIPVFSKDNEKTISHSEFIGATNDVIRSHFSKQEVSPPEIRVSHQIKGRTPTAIHKKASELLEHERTQFFERLSFVIRIPSISGNINGNHLSLMIGGVRAYNKENLYRKKTLETFQVFVGFQNQVCCNLCVSTDGYKGEFRVSSIDELQSKIFELIANYDIDHEISSLKSLSNHHLTEKQFANLLGRSRLYNYLPKSEKKGIPELLINDSQISSVAKDYYQDKRFCKSEDGTINLWKVYNLFTSATKSSYIDSLVDRNVNALQFTKGLSKAINDGSHHWFLN